MTAEELSPLIENRTALFIEALTAMKHLASNFGQLNRAPYVVRKRCDMVPGGLYKRGKMHDLVTSSGCTMECFHSPGRNRPECSLCAMNILTHAGVLLAQNISFGGFTIGQRLRKIQRACVRRNSIQQDLPRAGEHC